MPIYFWFVVKVYEIDFQAFLSKLWRNAIKPLKFFKGQWIDWNSDVRSHLHSNFEHSGAQVPHLPTLKYYLIFLWIELKSICYNVAACKSIWWFKWPYTLSNMWWKVRTWRLVLSESFPTEFVVQQKRWKRHCTWEVAMRIWMQKVPFV